MCVLNKIEQDTITVGAHMCNADHLVLLMMIVRCIFYVIFSKVYINIFWTDHQSESRGAQFSSVFYSPFQTILFVDMVMFTTAFGYQSKIDLSLARLVLRDNQRAASTDRLPPFRSMFSLKLFTCWVRKKNWQNMCIKYLKNCI